MSSSELLHLLMCPPCSPAEEAQAGVLSAHLLQQQALSAHPFFPKKEDPDPASPPFPFYIVVNHILEYVSVIFSNVESFALKALVAFNCGLRFNGSIVLKCVCKH